jgi:type II secretory pathway pseudopilin PulG
VKRHFIIFVVALLSATNLSWAMVKDSAEKSRTMATLANLRMALEYYVREYGMLPTGGSQALLSALTGTSTDGQNPRKIVFFEFRPPRTRWYFWTVDPGDRDSTGALMDGWGRPFVWIIEPTGTRITVKSLGKNGQDDGGNPDDVTISYPPSP